METGMPSCGGGEVIGEDGGWGRLGARIRFGVVWEKCCPDNPYLPVDHARRFKERIL
jgi:hypothetical protein